MAVYKKKKTRRSKKSRRKFYRKRQRVVNATSRSRVRVKATNFFTLNTAIPGGQTCTPTIILSPLAEVDRFTAANPNDQALLTLPSDTSTWGTEVVQLYAKMYDEIKVDGIYYEITVTNVLGSEGLLNAIRVYTAWDRKLTYNDTYYTGDSFPGRENMLNMGSVQTSTFGNNSVTTCYRACRASDFLEKFSFIDATYGNPTGKVYDTACVFNCNEGWFNAGGALSVFCPGLLLMISNEADYPSSDDIPFAISIKATCYYTFRCPKWAGAGAASSKSRQRLVVTKPGVLLPDAEAVGVCPKEELSLVLDEQTKMEDVKVEVMAGAATAAASTAGDQVQINMTPSFIPLNQKTN